LQDIYFKLKNFHRHYTEKIIPKLISQDGTEQTNISDILSEQQSSHKHLYSSTNPVINDVHKNAFLNDENPLFCFSTGNYTRILISLIDCSLLCKMSISN
jgi:hypothetical protein